MRRILLTVLFLTAFCGSIFLDSGGILDGCSEGLTFDRLLAVPGVMAQERLAEEPATGWSTPTILYPEVWPDPIYFSLSDDGARLVALIPTSGSDDNSRHLVVSESIGGVWQEPVVIAQNGAYSEALVQVQPQRTHPVISGSGRTIAYVGYTGNTFGVFVSDRANDGVWGPPIVLNTGLANTHYWISLSRDGNTLAVSDYPYWETQHLYVITRQAGVWGVPVRVSLESGVALGGAMPSLSEDGSRLAFIANARVMYSQKTFDGWTAPIALTPNDWPGSSAEYPQMSGSGGAIHYWTVVSFFDGYTLVRAQQNLHLMRWNGTGWDIPVQINATPILPSDVTDGPATANRYATRLVYPRPVTTTDPGNGQTYVSGSHLDMSEWINETWQTTRLVEANGFGNLNKWPRLTPLGKTLFFDGGIRYTSGLPVNGALWKMTTGIAPPSLPFSAFSLTGLIGGLNFSSLFSPFDNISYLFGPGTFTSPVSLTHTFWPDPPAPPGGLTPIGGIGGIGGLGGAFSASLLGPGGLPVQPNLPVTVTVDYSNTSTGMAIPGSLSLWTLNLGQWLPQPSFDDPLAGVLTATVSHFSQFAVFGETKRLYLPNIAR
jgi:hypothetical protein